MLLFLVYLTLLSATALAAPDHIIQERRIVEVYQKRQADLGQLLQLASLAGISALPTDPAVLLSLGPFANSLAAQLPTSSVLSVLLTAAPSGFISSIVNDPSFASSFESDFQKGSSPGWFNSLPTDVKSYLHTYSGFGAAATVAEGVKSEVSGTVAAVTGGSLMSSTEGAATATMTAAGSTVASASRTSTAAASGSGSGSGSESRTAETGSASSESKGSSSAASAMTGGASSVSSGGGAAAAAAQPTGAVVAGAAVFAGILGMVV